MGSDRFFREIEVAARLQHPHILPLLDSGEAAGFYFYVMHYVAGESLRERVDQPAWSTGTSSRARGEIALALPHAAGPHGIRRPYDAESGALPAGFPPPTGAPERWRPGD